MAEGMANAQRVCGRGEGRLEPPARCAIHRDTVTCDIDQIVQRYVTIVHYAVGDERSKLHIVNVLLGCGEIEQALDNLEILGAPPPSRVDCLTQTCRAIEADANILAHELSIELFVLGLLNLRDEFLQVLGRWNREASALKQVLVVVHGRERWGFGEGLRNSIAVKQQILVGGANLLVRMRLEVINETLLEMRIVISTCTPGSQLDGMSGGVALAILKFAVRLNRGPFVGRAKVARLTLELAQHLCERMVWKFLDPIVDGNL
eukprot:7386539-Prymnesium_polylepis.1